MKDLSKLLESRTHNNIKDIKIAYEKGGVGYVGTKLTREEVV